MATRTLVIAEPGATAQGNLETMIHMVGVAARCGADVYKSTWIPDVPAMMARRNFVDDPTKPALSEAKFSNAAVEYAYYRGVYEWHHWPIEWHRRLREASQSHGLQYACTVHTPDAVEAVAPFVDYIKIASFESDDDELVLAARNTGVTVIGSVGMGGERFYGGYALHCTSAYPAPLSDMNLKAIQWYDGLSDHSHHIDTGMMAVCLGASMIETHFRTYSCDPANPDYAVAFDPGELAMYIGKIRRAERMLGDGTHKIQDSERWGLPYKCKG